MLRLPPTRIGAALLLIGSLMILPGTLSNAQHLSSARGIALGAYTALAGDASALDWNPAGLASLRDWEVTTTSFLSPIGTSHSATFQLVSLGKNFSSEHAAAFRLSPGIELNFVEPAAFVIQDSSTEFKTQDRKSVV